MGFDPLDPAHLNPTTGLTNVELNGIAYVLNALSNPRRALALKPHDFRNVPSKTGAVLPPSPKGYTAFDAFGTEPRGPYRIIINNGTGEVFYTNNHYDSYWRIVDVTP